MDIKLDQYSKDASIIFNKMQDNLCKYENTLLSKMNGKIVDGFASFRSALWFLLFFILAMWAWKSVNHNLIIITMIIVGMLILFMIIENNLEFSYSKKIIPYSNAIAQMKRIISTGKESMEANQDDFIASKEKGWDFPLNNNDVEPLPEEIKNILTATEEIDPFKKNNNIIRLKNIFFFAAVVMITLVGCMAQFGVGSNIVKKLLETPPFIFDLIINFGTSGLILIVAILLSKLVWSKTDCNVTNVTLWITLFGPAVFTPVCWFLSVIVLVILKAIFPLILFSFFALLIFSTVAGSRRE
jgi:hypothetical protein